MNRAEHSQHYSNWRYRKITYAYALVLIVMTLILCNTLYTKEFNTIVNQLDQYMIDLNHKYESVTEDFWRLYMPFWTNRDQVHSAMATYFDNESNGELLGIDRRDVANALQIIMAGDIHMKWVGVFRGPECENYLYFQNGSSLIEMTEEFPFYMYLVNKTPGMEIYESLMINQGGETFRCFAICGGTAMDMSDGKIIMGFETEGLTPDYRIINDSVKADFYITNVHGVIFDSSGNYDDSCIPRNLSQNSIVRNAEGKLLYVRELNKDNNSYKLFCVVPWWDMFFQSIAFVPYILCVLVGFWMFSILLYRSVSREILGKVNAIKIGLEKITDNNLDYRIPIQEGPDDEFRIISQSINEMAENLQDNINIAYRSKLRQKEAELSELQAKFNPHFLYNTLEVIRGKVYENGDDETAEIIVKLAAIFRSFIGAENFISIHEEVEFCNLYLSLLKYRYDNEVKIVYDIDSQILSFGIIRNLLQPLLENYFVHGFNSNKQDNYLSIRGKLWDGEYICFIIRDNGLGITDERLRYLKNNLDSVETGTPHSYGLKNVHNRAKLFYGPECGLTIDRNEDGGATIRVLIRRMTCEEHKARLAMEG